MLRLAGFCKRPMAPFFAATRKAEDLMLQSFRFDCLVMWVLVLEVGVGSLFRV